MGKTVSRALMLAMAAGALNTPAALADSELSANVALTSDYVWRGVSQTGEDPALQVGTDFSSELFYVGAWASNIDFGTGSDADVELDLYAGFAGEFTPGFSWDVGAIGYYYLGAADGEKLDFYEVYAGLGYETDYGLGVGAYVYHDPVNENTYLEGTGAYAITDALSADVSFGHYSFDFGGDYTAWSVGGTYAISGFDIDLRYWDTDIEDQVGASVPGTEERVVATIGRTFTFGG